jgi:peptidoglycan/LPS O-acetylase OafA/YrhL
VEATVAGRAPAEPKAPPHTADLSHGRGDFLGGDGLRGIACVLVFTAHAGTTAVLTAKVPSLPAGFGFLGRLMLHMDVALYVFFVLSAYLISRPYIRAVLEDRPLPSLRNYARNRVLRIVPVFWILTTILVGRHLLLRDAFPRGTFASPAFSIAAIYLFLQEYARGPATVLVGQAWSLHVEIGFYLLLPLLAYLAVRLPPRPRTRLTAVLVTLAVLYTASLGMRLFTPETQPWRRSIPEMAFAFVPGVLLAAVETRLAPRLRAGRSGRRLGAALMVAGVLLLLLDSVLPNTGPILADTSWWRGVLVSMMALAFVAGPMVMQWSTLSCWTFLTARPVRWLGIRSYSFYILHQGIGFEMVPLFRGHGTWAVLGLAFAALLPLTLLLCHLSYSFFEAPFLRLKGRPVNRSVAQAAG